MPGLTERNKEHWDAMANSYIDNNEKTIEELIAEIRSRLDWIGVDFLNDDEGDEEDDELADADERANEVGGDGGKIERKVVRLLDYACGPGMVSRALAPYVSEIKGIDLSDSMVSVYNKNASNQGLSPNEMSAAVGNLLEPEDPSPADFKGEDWFNFDLAVVGFGFHHFEDPTLAATRLAERLKPGGVLMIIDFLPHEQIEPDGDSSAEAGPSHGHEHGHGRGIFHGHNHGHGHGQGHGDHKTECTPDSTEGYRKVMGTIAHAGFAQEDVQKAFEMAGVGRDFGFDILKKDVVFRTNDRKITRRVFFARGTKA